MKDEHIKDDVINELMANSAVSKADIISKVVHLKPEKNVGLSVWSRIDFLAKFGYIWHRKDVSNHKEYREPIYDTSPTRTSPYCHFCETGPCINARRKCGLRAPLIGFAGWRNPQGLIQAMYSIGYEWNRSLEAFTPIGFH